MKYVQREYTPDLKKKKKISLPILDLTTLLYNISQGSKEKNIGWEDAALSLNDIQRFVSGTVWIHPDHVESALWSCNLRDEKNKFWDHKGRTFEEYVKELAPNWKFNRDYNFFIKNGKKAKGVS